MNERKHFNYLHIICGTITLALLCVSVFVFPNAFGRLLESGRDLGLSIAYYFCELFGIEYSFTPTVIELPKIPFFPSYGGANSPSTFLPNTWTGFQSNWSAYWQLWVTKDNFFSYLVTVEDTVFQGCKFIIIVFPLVLVFILLFRRYLKKQNNDYNKDSKFLQGFKIAIKYTYRPVKNWVLGLISFIR